MSPTIGRPSDGPAIYIYIKETYLDIAMWPHITSDTHLLVVFKFPLYLYIGILIHLIIPTIDIGLGYYATCARVADCGDCRGHDILTVNACQKLSDRWGLNWKGSVGANSSLPRGCLFGFQEKGYNDAYFNEAKEGMKQDSIDVICRFGHRAI